MMMITMTMIIIIKVFICPQGDNKHVTLSIEQQVIKLKQKSANCM